MEDRDNGSELDDTGLEPPQDAWTSPTTRKSFLKGAAVAGAGATGLSALAPAVALAGGRHPAITATSTTAITGMKVAPPPGIWKFSAPRRSLRRSRSRPTPTSSTPRPSSKTSPKTTRVT